MSKFFEAKALREERGQIVARQNEIGNKIKSESRCVTEEEKTELVSLQARNVELKSQIETAELVSNIESVDQPHEDRQLQSISMKSGTRRTSPRDQEMALRAWALTEGGMASRVTSEMRDAAHRTGRDLNATNFALSTATAFGGDDASPENDQLMAQIEMVQKTFGEALNAVTVYSTTSGNPMPLLITDDTETVATTIPGARTSDLGSRAATSTAINATKHTLGAHSITSAVLPVPVELLADYGFPLTSMIAEALGERGARTKNALLTNGRGSAYDEFTGFVPSLVTANRVDTFVYLEGTTTGGEIYDILTQLKFSVDRYYRRKPKSGFMFSDSTLGVLASAKDGFNRPLFEITDNTIVCGSLRENYWVNNALVDIDDTSGLSLIYGDWSSVKCRQVGAPELVIYRETLRQQFNAIGLQIFERGDSLVHNPKALFGLSKHVVTSGG